jgi:GWxTD domain-containing protein
MPPLSSRVSKRLLLVPLLFLFTSLSLHAVDPVKNLSPRYRHWIEEEVPYIIQSVERKEFLSLKSDTERENFINAFWQIRNPDPRSEINEYKEEHYRRLAYANANFGNIKAQDGWRTDMGRIYITLGPPEQRANYPAARNLRPIIIWFYQSKTPALPTHFYILFYKRSIGEDFTLYSPYQDGPVRLVTGLEAKNDQKNGLDIIKRSLGNEVARTTISLIPGEPVNLNDYTPSLQSDVLLSTIKGLPDNDVEKERLAQRRAARESITTSVFLGSNTAAAQTAIFRDSTGRMTAHALVSYERPEPSIIGTLPDKKPGYSLTLQTSVLTPDGKEAIYQQNDKLTATVGDLEATELRMKRFGGETRIPLAPGQYQIVYTLTNDLTHSAVRQRINVKVPDPAQTNWTMSSILVFSSKPPMRDTEVKLPFSISGLRFSPQGVQQALLHAGEPLRLVFQLWSRPASPSSREGQKVKIHYVLGSVQSGTEPHQEDEEIDAGSFDESGTLLTGHTLSTEGLATGNYRVVITASDPATQQKAYATLNLRVVNDTLATDLWTAYDASEGNGRGLAIDDYKRALAAMMSGQNDRAISWLQRSIADDQTYVPALDRLVIVLSQSSRYKEVADLTSAHPIPHEVSPQTAILISQARAQTGDFKGATSLLEQQLQVQPPTADLYLALASIYEKQGNASRAEDYKQRAAKLTN